MSPEHKALVIDLMHIPFTGSAISEDEFLRRWPHQDGRRLGRELLAQALADRDGDDLELAFVVRAVFGPCEHDVDLLDAAARADWHTSHEEIAQALTDIATPDTLPALSELRVARPAYAVQIDEAVSIGRHALHGIARVPGAQARALLLAAVDDEREAVSANARRLLDRRAD